MKTVAGQLLAFLQQNRGKRFSGIELQRMDFKTRKGGLTSGDNIKRRLNELVEDKSLTVSYTDNIAYFSADESKIPKRKEFVGYVERDGQRYATFREVVAV